MSAAGPERRSLKHVSIFANSSSETLGRLEQRCRWRRWEPGKEVIERQGSATEVYFLTSGAARVVIHAPSGKNVAFRHIGPGDMFGELAAIDGEPRSASVEVLEPSIVASMSAWDFGNAVCDEPEIAMGLIRHLTAEARGLTARIVEFSTLAVRNRIHSELLRLAGGLPPRAREVAIRPAPTHSEIASRISTHREAVTREFGRLARLGLVERQGADLIVKDVTRLAEMVREAKGD